MRLMLRTLLSLLILLATTFNPFAFAGLTFDGTDDFASFSSQILNDGTVTFGALVKMNAVTADGAIIANWASGAVDGHNLQFDDVGSCGNDRFGYFFREVDGFNGFSICGSTTITTGVWYSVIVAVNSTSAELFLNGVSDGTSTDFNGGATACNSTECANTAYVGRTGRTTVQRYLNGEVDDVFVYSSVLTDDEISKIAKSKLRRIQLQTSPSNLASYVPMDDLSDGSSGDGVTFRDESGSNVTLSGDDGANNTGLTAKAGAVLSYA